MNTTHLDFCFVPVLPYAWNITIGDGVLSYETIKNSNHAEENIYLPPGSWQLLAISDEVTEEVVKGIVHSYKTMLVGSSRIYYKNYIHGGGCDTALDSFRSLLSAAGVQGRVAVLKKKNNKL